MAPLCSLINHSWVENAAYHVVSGKVVLFAQRPIANQLRDVLESLESPKSMREKNIKDRYSFKCNCQACEENWPVFGPRERVSLPYQKNNNPYFLTFPMLQKLFEDLVVCIL